MKTRTAAPHLQKEKQYHPIDPDRLKETLAKGANFILSQQHPDGYWWYTLEANDSIVAEAVFLEHYVGLTPAGLGRTAAFCRWLIKNQNDDGSWGLFYGAPGDISTTVECYLALKLTGFDIASDTLARARDFILSRGGLTRIRIFSRIHLALLGLVDWEICPQMPVSLIQLPSWAPVNIYEFASWARASIVPLLVIMDQKRSRPVPVNLDELYVGSKDAAIWSYPKHGLMSIERIFVEIDRSLRVVDRLGLKPLRTDSLKKCERYVREHLDGTEDIYPAMYYGLLALLSLGYPLEDTHVGKALTGLRSFQITMATNDKPLFAVPFQDDNPAIKDGGAPSPTKAKISVAPLDNTSSASEEMLYQQCCISPVWDTAWAGVALRSAGLPPDHPALLRAARWIISKQITDVAGDWAVKNPGIAPGGWSFEFANKYYPDVDDTIEVLRFLHDVDIPYRELKTPFERGVRWMASMQCANGGWAAFDKNNELTILNKIPFADHGACLDPPTADITGRMVEFLLGMGGGETSSPEVNKAGDFILARQERDGSFWGRWGVNHIYGTWGAVAGLSSLGRPRDREAVARAVKWLKTIQHPDGGWGESCLSYAERRFVPVADSVPSQTAWALLALISAGEASSEAARSAADWLIAARNADGSWDEKHFTGTGFPGHFFIRYHGYRHYFPLLALGSYAQAVTLS